MELDLLIDDEDYVSDQFTQLFSNINFIRVDPLRSVEAQTSVIEAGIKDLSIQKMLVYPKRYRNLGVVLSRRYFNSAQIRSGPLRLADETLLPDHLSKLPTEHTTNKVLFFAPHCDEAYLAAILLHKLIGDEVFLYSFTSSKKNECETKSAYRILGLEKDEYFLDSLTVNRLFTKKRIIKKIIRRLIADFKPSTVFSVFPKGANFDHMTMAQIVREVVLGETRADLIYGYVIQSRNIHPIIFPLIPQSVYNTILKAFGKNGFGTLFQRYVPFLKHYLHTFSEPISRLIGEKKLVNVYSLPLEAERLVQYRIPNLHPAKFASVFK